MNPSAPFPARPGRGIRLAILWASAVLIAAGAALAPPQAQPQAYHAFADTRAFFGTANFLDVASNLAFLAVGLAGLRFVLLGAGRPGSRAFEHPGERTIWAVVFAATALTCCGSWYYHLAPDDARLAWDRLPMAVAFMGIVAAMVSERIGTTAGRRLLVPLTLVGAATVWYWRWSAARGAESLNPYLAVQFGAVLLVLLMVGLFASRYTRGNDYLVAVGLYALAKVAEHFDSALFVATGGTVSGHTLKHVIAAASIFWLLRMLRRRDLKPAVLA